MGTLARLVKLAQLVPGGVGAASTTTATAATAATKNAAAIAASSVCCSSGVGGAARNITYFQEDAGDKTMYADLAGYPKEMYVDRKVLIYSPAKNAMQSGRICTNP